MNHDRVVEARQTHVKSSKTKRSCAACGEPWPCQTVAVLNELDQANRTIRQLRSKPPVPDALAERPKLPRLRSGGGREWRPRDEMAHARWLALFGEQLDKVTGHVSRRAAEDADDAIRSAPSAGGGSPNYERDGSRPGPTQGQALSHERVRLDGHGRQLDCWWVDDAIPGAHDRFLEGLERLGDSAEAMLPDLRLLFGISTADAKELVSPKPARCENTNCGRWVENNGTANERLIMNDRDGKRRCPACDQYTRRTRDERPVHLARPAAST